MRGMKYYCPYDTILWAHGLTLVKWNIAQKATLLWMTAAPSKNKPVYQFADGF